MGWALHSRGNQDGIGLPAWLQLELFQLVLQGDISPVRKAYNTNLDGWSTKPLLICTCLLISSKAWNTFFFPSRYPLSHPYLTIPTEFLSISSAFLTSLWITTQKYGPLRGSPWVVPSYAFPHRTPPLSSPLASARSIPVSWARCWTLGSVPELSSLSGPVLLPQTVVWWFLCERPWRMGLTFRSLLRVPFCSLEQSNCLHCHDWLIEPWIHVTLGVLHTEVVSGPTFSCFPFPTPGPMLSVLLA